MSHTNRRRQHSFDRSGFTLIETAITVCILSAGVALLSPAVYSARNSARKTQCISNLSKIGIALHDYHVTHNTFPAGWLAATPAPGQEFYQGWMAAILPHIEPADADGRLQQAIPVFRCPSDRTPPQNPLRGDYGTANYSGNFGSSRSLGWAEGSLAAYWPGQLPAVEGTGLFWLNSRVRLSDVKDGSSNVFMAGERSLISRSGIWAGVRGNEFSDDQVSDCDGFNELGSETGFSSRHAGGGAHFLMVDGDVEFINRHIASRNSTNGKPQALYQQLAHRSDGQQVRGFGPLISREAVQRRVSGPLGD